MEKLIAPRNRVIVKVDLESKNWHSIEGENGEKVRLRLERQYDNFNMRHVKPVNGIVVDAKNIPEGAEVLIHHNSTHDTYRIFNYRPLVEESSSDIKYYSIPEEECFFWREKGSTWNTLNNFITALRIFKPYNGIMLGIEPEKIKDVLYITSGDLAGKAALTLKASDYEIIFQNDDDKEESIIRLRYYNGYHERNEIIAVNNEVTGLIKSGDLLVGINKSDAKKLSEYGKC
jgi:hypothetical protein